MNFPTAAPAPAMVATAGSLKTVYGDWLRELGAIGGGETIAANQLLLRFETRDEAAAARATLVDALDGVQLLVATRDGGTGALPAASPRAAADLLGRLHELVRVQVRRTPEPSFVVSAESPDVLARLDPILRDEVAGLPVRWLTEGRPVPASAMGPATATATARA